MFAIIVHFNIQKWKNKQTFIQTEKAKSSHFDRTRGDKNHIFPTLVVFVPEFYLNKATEYVDPEDGPRRLDDLGDMIPAAATNPRKKKHLESCQKKLQGGRRQWMGEYPEMKLYNALTRYAEKKNESLAVFHGLNLYKFDPDRNPGKYTMKMLAMT